jgi:hypothetical protein
MKLKFRILIVPSWQGGLPDLNAGSDNIPLIRTTPEDNNLWFLWDKNRLEQFLSQNWCIYKLKKLR